MLKIDGHKGSFAATKDDWGYLLKDGQWVNASKDYRKYYGTYSQGLK